MLVSTLWNHRLKQAKQKAENMNKIEKYCVQFSRYMCWYFCTEHVGFSVEGTPLIKVRVKVCMVLECPLS